MTSTELQNLTTPKSSVVESQQPATDTQVSIDVELERDFKVLSYNDLIKIGQFCVFDDTGNRHAMSDLWTEFKTIFIFVRVSLN